jgi:hypothetical protein
MSKRSRRRRNKGYHDTKSGMRVYTRDTEDFDIPVKRKFATVIPNKKTDIILSDIKNLKDVENDLGDIILEKDKEHLARIIIALRIAQCEGVVSFIDIKNSLEFVRRLILESSLYILNNDVE